ncbi:hypothetical protein [Asticcacaulis sp. 201]|uniref:hypothetical protein n=1 Tax=Asticcacaulis sp. 201 TaxID=3028787 RepID=UPI0029160476|nr:hypothetical protein [Asticcacaulis sp. 201]MDV6331748.1 hypothetical protein [Asticcacaulis sp. 201]
MTTPSISLLAGGGFRVRQDDLEGVGATLPDALAALSAAITARYDMEKGDETAAAEDARRQADILANDRFIRGGQLQHSVLTAMAIGLI